MVSVCRSFTVISYGEGGHGVKGIGINLGWDEGENEVGNSVETVIHCCARVTENIRANVESSKNRVPRRTEGEEHGEYLAHDGRLLSLDGVLDGAELFGDGAFRNGPVLTAFVRRQDSRVRVGGRRTEIETLR